MADNMMDYWVLLGALEVVEHLNEHQIETDHPIIIIAFACEESTRFNEATLGSKYLNRQNDQRRYERY
jgi:hypothetical protein